MNDIFEMDFASPLNMQEMIVVLRQQAPDIDWTNRESEYDGIYIRGKTADGSKLRIIDNGQRFAVEVYFPRLGGEFSDSEKRNFLRRLSLEILPLVRAQDIVDVP